MGIDIGFIYQKHHAGNTSTRLDSTRQKLCGTSHGRASQQARTTEHQKKLGTHYVTITSPLHPHTKFDKSPFSRSTVSKFYAQVLTPGRSNISGSLQNSSHSSKIPRRSSWRNRTYLQPIKHGLVSRHALIKHCKWHTAESQCHESTTSSARTPPSPESLLCHDPVDLSRMIHDIHTYIHTRPPTH